MDVLKPLSPFMEVRKRRGVVPERFSGLFDALRVATKMLSVVLEP